MKTRTRILNIPWAAAAVAALVLASTPAHAAPTVWNVNMNGTITNYVGAAPENTPTGTWNGVQTSSVVTLADSTGDNTAGVTIDISDDISFGGSPTVGDAIFTKYAKDGPGGVNGNNGDPWTATFGNLIPGATYDVVVYSGWFWGPEAVPVTQTAGTGLTGTFTLNSPAMGAGNPLATGLAQDTDAANVAGNFNYARFNGLMADGSGNITLSFGISQAFANDFPINGFQLVKPDTADNTPPTPSPMTWASVPSATGEASITMTATTASDPSLVQYLFTETSNNPGATSSVWQDSPIYTDTGLNPGTTYTYTVTARDKSIANNETTPSTEESATTNPADNTAPTPDPMSFASLPAASSITKITMTATTASDVNGVEYYFTETTGNPGGSDSGWQDSPVYTDAGLNPGTSYTYKVKARDKSLAQNPTADSATASATTDTETVVSSVWNVNIGNEITTGDNFAGAAPENTVPNSFWNSVTTPNPAGLALADATSSNSAGVTLDLTGPTSYADWAPVTGPEIFSTWIKSTDNATPYTLTIGGLSFSKTYDLIIYSDWNWKGNGTLPLTQTLGSGLTGTVTLDQISTGTDGVVPGLVEDTDPLPNGATEGNWLRITGLTPDVNGNIGFLMGGTNTAFSGFQLVYPAGVVSSGFTTWAAANAGGQTAGEDFDNDGVENGIEYFMGETGSSFTANPSLNASNEISWPASAAYQGTYEVQTSPDLVNWTNVSGPKPTPVGGFLTYTLLPGAPGGKSFVRLLVTPTP